MVAEIVVSGFIVALIAGPLVWRVWRDRVEDRALAVAANVRSELVRAFGGEPAVAVRVEPRTPWREGRVILSTACHDDFPDSLNLALDLIDHLTGGSGDEDGVTVYRT